MGARDQVRNLPPLDAACGRMLIPGINVIYLAVVSRHSETLLPWHCCHAGAGAESRL